MSLADLRADLLAVLNSTDLPAYDHLPERITPPILLVEPDDPYLTDGDGVPFGMRQVAYQVYVIGRRGTSATQTTELDKHIVTTLGALDDSENWDVGTVARPYALQLGDSAYLATTIAVTTITDQV